MNNPRVLVVSTNRNLRRRVTRALTSAGFEVEHVSTSRAEVLAGLAREPAMCVVDADEGREDVRWVLSRLYDEHQNVICVVASWEMDSSFLIELLNQTNLNNIVARHGVVALSTDLIDESELVVTCRKLHLKDIFGLEKYLAMWGMRVHEKEIAASAQKQEVLSEIEAYLEAIDCYGAIKNSAILVTDELIMNAIYNAPRDGAGQPKYAALDRCQPLQLDPNERVLVRYACDGRNLAISVRDQFGSLDREVITQHLRRCFAGPVPLEDKPAGAGLGLYMVYNSITQLVFNIHANKGTEVIALFYVRNGTRAFRSSGRSLNLFFIK